MNKLKHWFASDSSLFVLVVIFLIIFIALGIIVGENMYTSQRLMLMGFQIPEFGLIALGMTFSFLLGGIDLSLVANANLSGILAAYILAELSASGFASGPVILLAVLAALLSAILLGLLNGVLVAKFSVPPMIATLSTMTFYTGIAMALTGGDSITGFPTAFTMFSTSTFLGIPSIFLLFLLITVVLGCFLSRTGVGRRIYLYGENPLAARFSAINNERLILSVFGLNGLLAGLSGLIIISRVTTAKVGYGDAYLVQAMLVAIIGGISPSGGKGKISGVIIAIAMIQLLSSAFTIWQLSPYNRKLIWGAVLILVILINHLIGKRRQKKESVLTR